MLERSPLLLNAKIVPFAGRKNCTLYQSNQERSNFKAIQRQMPKIEQFHFETSSLRLEQNARDECAVKHEEAVPTLFLDRRDGMPAQLREVSVILFRSIAHRRPVYPALNSAIRGSLPAAPDAQSGNHRDSYAGASGCAEEDVADEAANPDSERGASGMKLPATA